MSFFSVPLSGLNASQSMLQTISANLANVDTDGYKDQNLTFADLFAQNSVSNGAGDPIQSGQGVEVASTTSDFTDGSASATGIDSNMALSGNGFFVVQQPNGQIAYSRAGDFTPNAQGQLVTPDGSVLMGYPSVNGVVNTSAPLQPVQVGTGVVSPATVTTAFNMTTNLDASSAVGANVAGGSITVYDSLGASHVLNVSYQKTADNTWTYSITAPASDGTVAGATPGASTVSLATGTLNFDSSGNLVPSGTPAAIQPVALSQFTPADGASPMTLTWNLADASGNGLVTQGALASGNSATSQNGNPSGTLSTFAVQADGTIEGTFSNGTRALGQVAVATVTNEQGMQQIGDNLYQVTSGSGLASVGVAGTAGRGTITGGSVEESNVDVAAEFSKMIVAQQAYQANAKTVTTFDQVVQSTLAMLES